MSITTFESVKNQSTEDYFRGNQFSIDAFNKKYALSEDETYVKAIKRVCDYIASCEETPELKKYWSERWFDEIYNDWWHPAGSIMQGANSGKKVSLSNCTHISLGGLHPEEEWDNLDSIIKNTAFTVAKTAAYRQGLGVDFSRLRPSKMSVLNSSNESQGSLHWMKFIDSIGYFVGQKGRIPAMLFSLSCTHCDLIEFIQVKSDYTKIQNANISVQITDNFYDAVDKNLEWEMSFEIPEVNIGDKVYIDVHSKDMDCKLDDKKGKWYYTALKSRPYEKIVRKENARKILELIAKNMYANAEPGIQNIDIARKYSNSDYVYDPKSEYDSRIIGSNACCVPGDTSILTKTGYYPIESLVGKIADVWNGLEWSAVEPELMAENAASVKVILSDNTDLICTIDHRWMINRDGKNVKVRAAELQSMDMLVEYSYPVIRDGCKFSHAYTHGFYCGDGQKNNGNSKGALLYGEKQKLAQYLEGTSQNTVLKGDRVWKTFPMDMAAKFVVPINSRIEDKILWLSGLFDADACVCNGKKYGSGIQLSSSNIDFIKDIRLLLTTLGVQSRINVMHEEADRFMPDGHGGKKIYHCEKCYRLLVNSFYVSHLLTLGMSCHRLVLHSAKKPRNTSHKVFVKTVEVSSRIDKAYCFVEHKNGTGCFNGIITCNSEQYLSRDSLCVLASINASKFADKQEEYEPQLAIIGQSINRFLDSVNTMELIGGTYATPFQKIAIEMLRRTGAGYTNIAGWLFKQNLAYGESDGNKAVEKFTERYNYYLYKSSIELGKEKGSFGLFDRVKYEKSPFIKRMMALGLKFEAMRTCTCSSIAPTGTLALMFRDLVLGYGIEPAFFIYFWKRTRISGKYEYYFCIPSIVRETLKKYGVEIPMESDAMKDSWDGKIGKPIAEIIDKAVKDNSIKFKGSSDVTAFEKLYLMEGVSKWIDSSISVTYMLPEKTDWKDVYDFIILAHKKGLKSIAAFPDKKMYGIVTPIPFKDLAIKLTKEGISIHDQNFSTQELKELQELTNIVVLGKDQIATANAPKRPQSLNCDVHHIKVSKKLDKVRTFDYLVTIGLMNSLPYELFLTENGFLDKKYTSGIITREKKGVYSVKFEDGTTILDVTKDTSENEDVFSRSISTMLRHGVPLQYIIDQLTNAEGDMWSLAKVTARALKKYVKEGTTAKGLCPKCGSGLVYHDGCKSCVCGFSACN